MGRSKARVNYSTFVGGKMSDSNPILSPENVVRTLNNVDVNKNGKIGRRLGLEPETNFNLPQDVNNSSSVYLPGTSLDTVQDIGIDIYKWENVDDQPGVNYQCVRIGNTIYIYNEGGEVLSDSLVRTVDISPMAVSSEDIASVSDFQAVSGTGILTCTGSAYKPFYIKYNTDSDLWTTEIISIQVRDFEGVEDSLEPDEMPTNLSNEHKYNLYNQGWSFDKMQDTRNSKGAWPSNAQIEYFGWWVNDNGNPQYKILQVTDSHQFGNTLAPRGHFVVDPFDGNSRFTKSSVPIFNTSTLLRPKAVAFYAGRFFYGSVKGTVYYSQIIKSESDLGKCYQEQDPTAEDFNELLDTDGGTIRIIEIGDVERMEVIGDALVLFGTHGIHAISGGDSGFTASQQLKSKVSSVTTTNYRSVVRVEGGLMFWAEEGIYSIGPGDQGPLTLSSMTENRIQRDYDSIPPSAKAFAQGTYDRVGRQVYWSYSNYTQNITADIHQKYTNMLIYSVPLGAFWDYTLSNEGFTSSTTNYPLMVGTFSTSFRRTGEVEENVTVSNAIVSSTGVSTTLRKLGTTGDLDTYTESSTYDNTLNTFNILQIPNTSRVIALSTGTGSQYSDDGDTWTAVTGPQVGGMGNNLRSQCIAYSPLLNRVVAIGGSGVSYSDDEGETWTDTNLEGTTYDTVALAVDGVIGARGVFWDNSRSRFYAIPSYFWQTYGIWAMTSSDGITWTKINLLSTITATGISDSAWSLYDYVYSEETGTLVCTIGVSGDTARLYSTDGGTTWGISGLATGGVVGVERYGGVAYNRDTGVYANIDAENSLIELSSDGVNWTSHTPSGLTYEDLTYSHVFGKFIALGASNTWATSRDGITWTGSTASLPSIVTGFSDYNGDSVVTVDDGMGGDLNVTIAVASDAYSGEGSKVVILLPDEGGELRVTFGQFSSRAFHDWDSLDSTALQANVNYSGLFPVAEQVSGNYISEVETLPQTLNEVALQKQALYVHSYYDYRRQGFNDYVATEEFDT